MRQGEPLPEIRDYFGDQIAMYVAFLAFYTRWLSYPGLVGLGFQIWSWVKGHDNYGLVAYCIFICLWSVLFIKFWERKQSALSYYWSLTFSCYTKITRYSIIKPRDGMKRSRITPKTILNQRILHQTILQPYTTSS